jgi:hypothetical protein
MNIVREMESDNELQLGDFMMRLHELEKMHHIGKKKMTSIKLARPG